MKKCILLLLTAFMLFAFCACSNGNAGNVSEVTEISTTQKSVMTEASTAEKFNHTITVRVGDKAFTAQIYDNETAKAFSDMLPLSLTMNELHGNEKYYYLSTSLPTDSVNVGSINNGDIMLYGNDCLVLFYDSFSTGYSYTKIGYIENPTALADAVGNGDVTITFEK